MCDVPISIKLRAFRERNRASLSEIQFLRLAQVSSRMKMKAASAPPMKGPITGIQE